MTWEDLLIMICCRQILALCVLTLNSLSILLPLPPKYWESKQVPTHLSHYTHF